MENKFKNLLTSTTLIPLWAKAVESVSKDPILKDKHALEILRKLGYDLAKHNDCFKPSNRSDI